MLKESILFMNTCILDFLKLLFLLHLYYCCCQQYINRSEVLKLPHSHTHTLHTTARHLHWWRMWCWCCVCVVVSFLQTKPQFRKENNPFPLNRRKSNSQQKDRSKKRNSKWARKKGNEMKEISIWKGEECGKERKEITKCKGKSGR